MNDFFKEHLCVTASARDTMNYTVYTVLVDSPKVLSGLPRFHLSIRISLLIVGVLIKRGSKRKIIMHDTFFTFYGVFT